MWVHDESALGGGPRCKAIVLHVPGSTHRNVVLEIAIHNVKGQLEARCQTAGSIGSGRRVADSMCKVDSCKEIFVAFLIVCGYHEDSAVKQYVSANAGAETQGAVTFPVRPLKPSCHSSCTIASDHAHTESPRAGSHFVHHKDLNKTVVTM